MTLLLERNMVLKLIKKCKNKNNVYARPSTFNSSDQTISRKGEAFASSRPRIIKQSVPTLINERSITKKPRKWCALGLFVLP